MLEEYLRAYVKATKRARKYGIYYIDLFAGPGKNRLRSTEEIKNGSPLISLELEPSFTRYFFIEADKRCCDSLLAYIKEYPQELQDLVSVYCGDCNIEMDRVLAEIPQRNPAFAFLDPESTELRWSTIEKLASHKKPPNNKIELFILFPYNMVLVRWLTLFPEIVERVMPPRSNWQQIHYLKVSGQIDKNELRRRLVEEYENGLKQLGYKYVLPGYLFKSERNRPLYFMLFASDHPLGAQIMQTRFSKLRHGDQLSFWGTNQDTELTS